MQIHLEKVIQLVSRTGRQLQRYHFGRRQVVGCIPYRYSNPEESPSSGRNFDEVEVLLVSSQKGKTMMFPKGGWELDEDIDQAAKRESLEEAGVIGTVESKLGEWRYKSKSQDVFHDGHMFPLLVKKLLDHWPEENSRQRRWVKIKEAREICPDLWMKEALDRLVSRLSLLEITSESKPVCYESSFSDIISCGQKRHQALGTETPKLENVISMKPPRYLSSSNDGWCRGLKRCRTGSFANSLQQGIVNMESAASYLLEISRKIGCQTCSMKNQTEVSQPLLILRLEMIVLCSSATSSGSEIVIIYLFILLRGIV